MISTLSLKNSNTGSKLYASVDNVGFWVHYASLASRRVGPRLNDFGERALHLLLIHPPSTELRGTAWNRYSTLSNTSKILSILYTSTAGVEKMGAFCRFKAKGTFYCFCKRKLHRGETHQCRVPSFFIHPMPRPEQAAVIGAIQRCMLRLGYKMQNRSQEWGKMCQSCFGVGWFLALPQAWAPP